MDLGLSDVEIARVNAAVEAGATVFHIDDDGLHADEFEAVEGGNGIVFAEQPPPPAVSAADDRDDRDFAVALVQETCELARLRAEHREHQQSLAEAMAAAAIDDHDEAIRIARYRAELNEQCLGHVHQRIALLEQAASASDLLFEVRAERAELQHAVRAGEQRAAELQERLSGSGPATQSDRQRIETGMATCKSRVQLGKSELDQCDAQIRDFSAHLNEIRKQLADTQ
jgi:chromosome segregation ATPase